MRFYKKSSNMPCVVWAEEYKTGLGFEVGPGHDDVPTTSQFLTDGQSSRSQTYCPMLFTFIGGGTLLTVPPVSCSIDGVTYPNICKVLLLLLGWGSNRWPHGHCLKGKCSVCLLGARLPCWYAWLLVVVDAGLLPWLLPR